MVHLDMICLKRRGPLPVPLILHSGESTTIFWYILAVIDCMSLVHMIWILYRSCLCASVCDHCWPNVPHCHSCKLFNYVSNIRCRWSPPWYVQDGHCGPVPFCLDDSFKDVLDKHHDVQLNLVGKSFVIILCSCWRYWFPKFSMSAWWTWYQGLILCQKVIFQLVVSLDQLWVVVEVPVALQEGV